MQKESLPEVILQPSLSFIKSTIAVLFMAGMVFFSSSLLAHAAVTYDFTSDSVGQTPVNTTVTGGTFNVVNDGSLGQSLKALTQTGVIAGIIFDQFATSSDYSVTWKQSYDTTSGRGGFTLRAQATSTDVVNSSGAKLGYLFQVYDSNSVYIWRVGTSTYTSLWSGSLAKDKPRWFKAIAQGTSLGFYYSDDGVSYTLLASTTDATYSSGVVQYTAGYGAAVNNDVVDDVVIAPTGIDITGSSNLSGTVGVAMPITDLQIANATTTIPVKLFVTSGSLSMSTTTGITFDGASTGSTIYFSGSPVDVNNALASLRYTRGSVGTDTLEVSLVTRGEVFFSGTGHLYEYISSTLTWTNAKTAAEALSKYGATGYLTTITSQAENDFVAARLANAGWMGASDSSVEGTWRWVVGPENDTAFWSGASGGSTVGGNYANWGTGEPNNSGDEDCAQFLAGGSGKWNDLPCNSTTLPGYVVEYGTTGAQPAVTAKNITITTSDVPVVNSFSPADNATGIVTGANLVIVFSKVVSTSTGEIAIRRISDDAVVETIAATSSLITGGGTNTITINPITTLQESTGYYVTIPSTLFRDGSNVFYAGTSASTTWNFTTGDFTAPVISSLASVAATTSSSITWTTSELSSTRSYFGPSSSFGSSTVLADISPRVTSHSVSISGLMSCTTYYYQVVSSDASSNTSTSSVQTFSTVGCSGDVTPITATSTIVSVATAATSSLSQGSTTLSVVTPSNFTATTSSVVIQIQSLVGTTTLETIGRPSSLLAVGGIVFDVKAIIDSHTVLDSFDAPITIRYQYTDEDILGLNELSLRLYHYHNSAWSPLDDCVVDGENNIITCSTPSFSIFSLFGQTATVTISGGVQYGCTDPKARNYNQYVVHRALLCEYASAPMTALVMTETVPATEHPNPEQVSVTTQSPLKGYQFTKNMRMGAEHSEVKKLQEFLNSRGYLVAKVGAGSPGNETTYFGGKTKAALIAFQEAHPETILTSQNITKGTGHFLSYTKAFVNSLLAKE